MSTPPPPSPGSNRLARRGIQPRLGELGQRCRKLVLEYLATGLAHTFVQVDDTLFEAARKAENDQVQALFFDSMRTLRTLRPRIERQYHQAVSRGLSDFIAGQPSPTEPAPVAAEELTLVSNDDHEESLQVGNMANRVKASSARTLLALERRLAVLNQGQALDLERTPFAPRAIAQAFRQALAPCELPLRIRLVLYSLYDLHVMHGLDTLYQALDRHLQEAGILPNLELPPLSPAIGGAANVHRGSAAGDEADPDASAEQLQLLADLHGLLASYRREYNTLERLGTTPSMDSFAPGAARRTYDAVQLLDALDRLQQQCASAFAGRQSQPLQGAWLKAELQQQLANQCDSPQPHRLGGQENDVIDLVGMLFDFILNDDALPPAFKVTLSYLHTPYLKVALQDKALFIRRSHPARMLIDAMAKAGVVQGGQDLLAKTRWVVEQVIRRFDGDLHLFSELLNEFDAFTAALAQRAELQERRAVEAASGRDRLLAARQSAAQVIARSLNRRSPPGLIRQFLERTWIEVLVFVHLRSGDQGQPWLQASDLAEHLAWSGTPLAPAELERLQQRRAAMLEAIREGLLLLGGYDEAGIRRLQQDLVACQHAVQARQPQVADALSAPAAPGPLGAMLDTQAELPRPALSLHAQRLVQELERAQLGTWFEFIEGEQRRTLKLAWHSTLTRHYLFVDHLGREAALKSVEQLAWEMERGQARPSAPDRASPMVDRALSAVYRVLQQLAGRDR